MEESCSGLPVPCCVCNKLICRSYIYDVVCCLDIHAFEYYSYMFDEPSSYLDVKQRLKAALAIRDLLAADR